jgi:hypothetical protein
MATFITSKGVGQNITISVETSTGYWKYNHNGTTSSVFGNGKRTVTVANANGEFTLIPCLADGTVSGDITALDLKENQLTSFDGTGLTALTGLGLNGNQLTTLDITGLNVLQYLYVNDNLLTPSVNNTLLAKLAANELANDWDTGEFYTEGGRTAAGTTDYDYLIANGWDISGVELTFPVTFITSKGIGETITIRVYTSTTYWKYNHDGTDSSVFSNGSQTITVANANGEFTLIPCLSDGTPSGNFNNLDLEDNNQITSFDGTNLSGLTILSLGGQQLTSFNGSGLIDLIQLYLGGNQLTSFDGTDLTSLTELELSSNQLTSFDGTGLSGLTYLNLADNFLTSFDGTDLSALTLLYLDSNQLTSFDGTGLTGLTNLILANNQLTAFTGTGLSGLTELVLSNNQLNSINITDLNSLRYFYTGQNPINTALVNDTILAKLAANQLENGWTEGDQSTFVTAGGRTAAGTADYNYLIANGWDVQGANLPAPPSSSGKIRVRGITQQNP